MVDVSIVIVSYNTKNFLKECLSSIDNSFIKDLNTETIVVDNASKDNSVEELKDKFKSVVFIQNKENLGYSKANNIGVKKAKGKYILFLNPDTIITQKAIKVIRDFVDEDPTIGAATCKVILPSGELDDACHRGFPTPWNAFCYFSSLSRIFPKFRIFSGYSLGWMDLSTTHEIDACAGAFMMVKREAGEEIGWWDDDFFWYGEDLDLCFRLKQKGWRIYYVPAVSIIHHKGVSGGIKSHSKDISTATDKIRIKATQARFEAMRIFYKKHYINKYPKVLNWLVMQAINIKLKASLKSLNV